MMGWQLTFVSSAVVYVVCLQFFFRPSVVPLEYAGIVPNTREFLVKEGREWFLDGVREEPSVRGSGEIISPPTPLTAEEKQGRDVEKGFKM